LPWRHKGQRGPLPNDALKIVMRSADKEDRSGVIRNMARFMHRDLPKGGQLEDIAKLLGLGLRGCYVGHLPRREAAGGRLGRTVQLQADEAAACSSFGWRIT